MVLGLSPSQWAMCFYWIELLQWTIAFGRNVLTREMLIRVCVCVCVLPQGTYLWPKWEPYPHIPGRPWSPLVPVFTEAVTASESGAQTDWHLIHHTRRTNPVASVSGAPRPLKDQGPVRYWYWSPCGNRILPFLLYMKRIHHLDLRRMSYVASEPRWSTVGRFSVR